MCNTRSQIGTCLISHWWTQSASCHAAMSTKARVHDLHESIGPEIRIYTCILMFKYVNTYYEAHVPYQELERTYTTLAWLYILYVYEEVG
jgi:hypothetical protein